MLCLLRNLSSNRKMFFQRWNALTLNKLFDWRMKIFYVYIYGVIESSSFVVFLSALKSAKNALKKVSGRWNGYALFFWPTGHVRVKEVLILYSYIRLSEKTIWTYTSLALSRGYFDLLTVAHCNIKWGERIFCFEILRRHFIVSSLFLFPVSFYFISFLNFLYYHYIEHCCSSIIRHILQIFPTTPTIKIVENTHMMYRCSISRIVCAVVDDIVRCCR